MTSSFGSTAGPRVRRSIAPQPESWGGLFASPLAPMAISGGLAALTIALGWRGADTANHLFRIELFRRAGFTVWDSAWYGGHYLPGYSVLLAPLGALLGPNGLGVVSAVLAAVCFDLLLRARLGSRCAAGSCLFAAGTATNLIVGRLAFALGLAIALAALLAADRGRWSVARGLSAATALASPVAAVFLALAWLAHGLSAPAAALPPRRLFERSAVLIALSIAPVLVVAVAFPEGGTFPFRWSALLLILAVCAAALAFLSKEPRALRIGAALYAGASLLVFAVPNPLGGNLSRLAMYAAAPLLVAFAPRRRGLWLVVPLLVGWQWSPAIDGIVRSGADPSVRAAYYAPLVHFLEKHPGLERIEIPLTQRHFELAYVAPVVPLARGGERQIDRKINAALYSPALSSAGYRGWLMANGVQLIALADAPLDPSAFAEVQLIDEGQPYLRPIWAGPHWKVWELVGARGIVGGPARLVRQTVDTVVLDATAPGSVVVRVHWSDYWSVDGPACAREGADGWVHLEVRRPGSLVLHQVVIGHRVQCDVDDSGDETPSPSARKITRPRQPAEPFRTG